MSTNDKPTSDSAAAALDKAESNLQFAQDKRVQDAAVAAGISTEPAAETPIPRMKPIAPPTEDEVRTKAYELWQQGGYPEGEDQHHWFKAIELLSADQKNAAGSSGGPQVSSIADVVSDGMQSVAALATVAMQAFTGLFGPSETDKKSR